MTVNERRLNNTSHIKSDLLKSKSHSAYLQKLETEINVSLAKDYNLSFKITDVLTSLSVIILQSQMGNSVKIILFNRIDSGISCH